MNGDNRVPANELPGYIKSAGFFAYSAPLRLS